MLTDVSKKKQPKICIQAWRTAYFCPISSQFFFHCSCFAYSSTGQVPCKMNSGDNSSSFVMPKGIFFPMNLKALKYLVRKFERKK